MDIMYNKKFAYSNLDLLQKLAVKISFTNTINKGKKFFLLLNNDN